MNCEITFLFLGKRDFGNCRKQRTRFPFHSTKNKKWENGEDIEQGSSLAVVFNQSKKNWSNKNVFLSCETWNVEFVVCEKWNSHFIFHQTWSIPNLVGRVLSYPPLRRRENLGTRLINATPPPRPSALPLPLYHPQCTIHQSGMITKFDNPDQNKPITHRDSFVFVGFYVRDCAGSSD